jgi:hypothetical protein
MSVKHPADTYIQLVQSGKLLAEDIDEFVEAWHASDDPRKLSEALGFSEEEYALWVEEPGALKMIITSRAAGGSSTRQSRR